MTALLARFDDWANATITSARSLGIYRIVYAAAALAIVRPPIEWAQTYPDSIYAPPPGPWRLFDGFPPYEVLSALIAILDVALVALLLGWHTKAASYVCTVTMLVLYGWHATTGKIDHPILLVLVPAVVAQAGWGNALSVDALRGRVGTTIQQWPMRLLALLVGLGFFTAGWAKLSGGWLNPSTHAVQGVLFRQYHVNDRQDLLAGFFLDLRSPVFWEVVDVATILLECGIVFAALWWPAWRVAIAAASTFHLGVFLMMNIAFSANLLVYGAFVKWSVLRLPSPSPGFARLISRAAPLVAVGGGLLVWLAGAADSVRYQFFAGIVYAGGALGGVYLALVGRDVMIRLRGVLQARRGATPQR